MPNYLRRIRPYVFGNLYFTIGTSVVTGSSNSIASAVQTSAGISELLIDFFQAGGGNLGFGLVVKLSGKAALFFKKNLKGIKLTHLIREILRHLDI